MKQYIITIIGASVLASLAGMLAPEKWRGYVQIITGLVIISCIASPIFTLTQSGIPYSFYEDDTAEYDGNDIQRDIVVTELEGRINADIAERMKNEYNLNITAECRVRVNGEGEIDGLESLRVSGDALTPNAVIRLCEVYGLKPEEVYDDE